MTFKPLILNTEASLTDPAQMAIQDTWVTGEVFVEFTSGNLFFHNFDFKKTTTLTAKQQSHFFNEMRKQHALAHFIEDADAQHNIFPSGSAQMVYTKDAVFLHDANTCQSGKPTPAQRLTVVLLPPKSKHTHLERLPRLPQIAREAWTYFTRDDTTEHPSIALTTEDFL